MPVTAGSERLDFERMFRSMPSPCTVSYADAPHYTIAEVNEAFLRTAGRRRDALVGQSLLEVFFRKSNGPGTPEVEELRQSFDAALRSGRPEVTALHRTALMSGQLAPCEWKVITSPVFDAQGRITHLSHRIQDEADYQRASAEHGRGETERERLTRLEATATSRAKAAENQLHRVYQQAPIPLALMSGADHVYEFANRRYVEMAGSRPLLGRTAGEMCVGPEGDEFLEFLDRAYASGQMLELFERPVWLQTRDGRREAHYFNFVFQPLLDASGATESIAVVASDVTEQVTSREQAELAAAERDAERRRLLAVLDQSPLGITIVEAPSGRLLFANSRAAQIYGRSPPSLNVGEYLSGWGGFDRDGRRLTEDEWPLTKAIRTGDPVESQGIWIEHAKGHRMEIIIKAAPVRSADGEVIAGVAIFWDVTAERRTERQLREAQRLQAVGTLAGGVAHEVNNQMTAVLGFGEFVLRALGPDHPQTPDQRQVLLAADRAARVSQQLLAFTRQQVNQPRVIELGELAERLRPVLQQLLGSDKELVITPTRPRRRVNADPVHVEQVLINLVANARDATETGGRVTISVEDAEVTETPVVGQTTSMAPGPYVVLTVADSGAGIDAETLTRIFEPFFTTKPVGQGTGLGLSMVYGIVKQHGGYIWAKSRPGQGTAMQLYWPAVPSLQSPEQEDSVHERAESTALGSAATVLVVEDEASVRQLAVRSLEHAGFTVLEAEDGRVAVHMLSEENASVPDLLVTDAVMPHMSGRELSETAAGLRPGLPVLFISGYAGDEVVLRRLVPEGAAFLQKPFTPDQLVRAVGRLLSRRDR